MNNQNHRESSIEYRASRIENPVIYVPIRHYNCRENSTNQPILCKTNPILSAVGGLQMNSSLYTQTDYENNHNWTLGENKPNSNPIKPNLKKAKMNVNSLITKDYRKNEVFVVRINKPNFRSAQNERKLTYNNGLQKKRCFSVQKNKPNSNPNKPKTNPISPNPKGVKQKSDAGSQRSDICLLPSVFCLWP